MLSFNVIYVFNFIYLILCDATYFYIIDFFLMYNENYMNFRKKNFEKAQNI